MAHKGYLYPVDQWGRLYSGDATWPFFVAKQYEIRCDLTNNVGDTLHFENLAVEQAGWSAGDFEYFFRGSAGTWMGFDVEVGYVFAIDSTTHLWYAHSELWLDGLPTIVPHSDGAVGDELNVMADTLDDTNCTFPFIVPGGYGVIYADAIFWP